MQNQWDDDEEAEEERAGIERLWREEERKNETNYNNEDKYIGHIEMEVYKTKTHLPQIHPS